jgi:hypothetical protein
MKSLPFSQSHLVRLLLLLLLLAPVSCAILDPGYSELVAAAETYPSKDAIVGMWHRTNHAGMGSGIRMSLLISRDGTGLVDSVVEDMFAGTLNASDEIGPFTWHYEGAGVWALKNGKGRIDHCRLANGKLLRVYSTQAWQAFGVPAYFLYERVTH